MDKLTTIKFYLFNGFCLYCSNNYVAHKYMKDDSNSFIRVDYMTSISDYLNGFDETEPVDSPYRFGNHSISKQIKEISQADVINLFGIDVLSEALSLFKNEDTP